MKKLFSNFISMIKKACNNLTVQICIVILAEIIIFNHIIDFSIDERGKLFILIRIMSSYSFFIFTFLYSIAVILIADILKRSKGYVVKFYWRRVILIYVLLLVIAVIFVFAGEGKKFAHEVDAYEFVEIFFQNIVIGLISGCIGAYFVDIIKK